MASASIVNRSFWNERTSSGSSLSLRDANRARWGKSTVTSRRSASGGEATGAGRAAGLVAAAAVGAGFASRDAPHFGQKEKSDAHANPQPAHSFGRRRPHFGQNA